jgi:hypothetical protein
MRFDHAHPVPLVQSLNPTTSHEPEMLKSANLRRGRRATQEGKRFFFEKRSKKLLSLAAGTESDPENAVPSRNG